MRSRGFRLILVQISPWAPYYTTTWASGDQSSCTCQTGIYGNSFSDLLLSETCFKKLKVDWPHGTIFPILPALLSVMPLENPQAHFREDARKMSCSKHDDPESPVASDSPMLILPEGGRRGWLTVLGAFLIQFCTYGSTIIFSQSLGKSMTHIDITQDFYTREYLTNTPESAVSWVGSINAFLSISFGIVSGRLYDMGHFYTLLYFGSCLTSLSLFLLSLCQPNHFYQILLTQGIGAGLGSGITYVPTISVVSHDFSGKDRLLAMTVVASGSSLGAVVHPIMLNNLLHNERLGLGFGNVVRISAGMITALLLIGCGLMRTRGSGAFRSKEKALKTSRSNIFKTFKQSAKDKAYVAATLGLSIFVIGYYLPFFYIQLDASVRGLNTTFSFYSLVILNASSFFGRIIPGFLSQKSKRFGDVGYMLTFSVFCCSVLIFSMIAVKSIAGFVVVGILYGFFAGAFVALMAPLIAILTEDHSELGARIGISWAFAGLGGLIGGPIDGALLNHSAGSDQYDWWKPALFSGIMALTGCLMFGFMLLLLSKRSKSETGADKSIIADSQEKSEK
ncbi:hypothetical protein D9758_012484 [Tetrapyrgos nigripes]|uniref:Major facilitator superfamily (MFS) profile domain-containing protein n=1 Tax=Tetrapyrgos nigripes TaxID=182062 RepID=A0A8H5CYJ2_9AGAR|nr:hypothetical protein D9758_012484 [Tetrapyrgos nigripes]